MSYHCSPRPSSARTLVTAGVGPVPVLPAAPGCPTQDADCLSGICLPSSFQTGSWLLDHCAQEPAEPPACPPAARLASPGRAPGARPPAGPASPCSAARSRPLSFVSGGGQPAGGSPGAQPGSANPRAARRPFVSGCRRTC